MKREQTAGTFLVSSTENITMRMILLISTCKRVGVFCRTECSSSVFFSLKTEDVFSFQTESLPEVFCHYRVRKSILSYSVFGTFCVFAKLEGVWKSGEMMMDNLRRDKMKVGISM